MWKRKPNSSGDHAAQAIEAAPQPLKDAVRVARIESAERSGVVVELRDAALARLELLNDALDPIFTEIPADIDLFDRGISRGDTPRLWIDSVAFVEMGRDRRTFRLLQDTRYGRKILAEGHEIGETVNAITRYLAGRLVERERALTGDADLAAREERIASQQRRRNVWRVATAFLFGIAFTFAALFMLAWWISRP